MDAPGGDQGTADLTWENVGLAFSFIIFDAAISRILKLGVGTSLVTAAVRCVIQLTLVSLVLQKVFEAKNPWGVAGIAFLLNLMGTIETVVNKAKRRYEHMFPSVLFAMLFSTIPVSIIGIRFAMSVDPFWKPEQYIPVVGMLCGATISGIVVACNYVLKELYENRDKIETYLAFGASRFEACKPIATDALRLALTPNINQMSVLGIIAIPGMMTGAILGGSSVQQAARLQMVIMFMISSCTALASIVTTVLALSVVVDAEHRIRTDKIDGRPHAVWRARDRAFAWLAAGLKALWLKVTLPIRKRTKSRDEGEEQERLLG
ncbi:ABC transporter permease [Phanerochaete sordida]|uniref:ABC transporter permease n=1 Tax=Phanerochaete sordida TaxID=48140 RepID=A0A9P3GI87_9APHY|nr:ABC transporter permease [Phanerochaete sordida]